MSDYDFMELGESKLIALEDGTFLDSDGNIIDPNEDGWYEDGEDYLAP